MGLLIDNTTPLAAGVTTGLSFKAGTYYTGRIRTYGTAANYSNMGFFTFAVTDSSLLRERMTITDGGLVGINNTAPAKELDVTGDFRTTGDATLGGNMSVAGIANMTSIITSGNINATGSVTSGGAAAMNSTLTVAGLTSLSTLGTSGNASVGGTLQVQGGSPAAGKVLTATNTGGNAVWSAPAAPSANTGFRATAGISSTTTVANNALLIFPYDNVNVTGMFDDGGNFNVTTHGYTAPAAGVYQFNALAGFTANTSPGSGYLYIQPLVNGSALNMPKMFYNTVPGQLLPGEIANSFILKLAAGDVVTIQINNSTGVALTTNQFQFASFSGVRLY